tara:strand:+ start:2017 stop:2784 length:768 start_codon:yes stop_codon:yes gene_type:complete
MNTEQLRSIVPAAFADSPASHVSDKYIHVPTNEVLKVFEDEGWDWTSARQQNCRDEAKVRNAKHTIILRPSVEATNNDLGGLRPQIRIINSGDWSSRLEIAFMLWRMVCSNGMHLHVAVQAYNVRHDQISEDIHTILARFPSASSKMLDKANTYSQRKLGSLEVTAFGMAAARLRFKDPTPDHAMALLETRRPFDAGNSLWNVMNRVQENGVRGGIKLGDMKRPIRQLTNISAERDYNNDLAILAEQYLNPAQAF